MATSSDEDLLDQYRKAPASNRGRSCLNELFERHHSRVAAWCYRMTGDVNSATDLAQEVFLKAFQRIDTFRTDARFTTWLYSIMRNHCLDELRSRSGQPAEVSEEALEIVSGSEEDALDALERKESEQILRKLIEESLDETESRVMTLHYFQEMPLDAITRLLRLTNQSGAKAYIVSARRKLNRGLAAWKGARGRLKGSPHAE